VSSQHRRFRRAFGGKVAIVTGGASGIGLALGNVLADAGAKIVLADRDGDEVMAAAAERRELSGVKLDVTDAPAFKEAAQGVLRRHGRLDLLFNNAGVGLAGEVRDLDIEAWRAIVDVNLYGVANGIAAVYPLMLERRDGAIVNTASGAGLLPRPGMAPYAATKHAVVGLTTSLRAEAAPHGVNVSVVCPGYIATSIMESTKYVGVDADGLTGSIPIKPMSPEDCARLILEGVIRNRPIIMVSRILELEWLLYRLSPTLGIKISRIRGRAFSKHRTNGRDSVPTTG